MMRRFIKDKAGATAIEYGLIGGIMAIALIAGVGGFAGNLSNMFNMISNTVTIP